MTRKLIAGAILLFGLTLGVLLIPSVVRAQGESTNGEDAATAIALYRAVLLPENEVPPVTGTQASGKTWIVLDTDTNTIAYAIGVVSPSSTIVGGHIHTGTVGVNGPVLVDLLGGETLTPDSPLFGFQTIPPTLAQNLGNGGYYVNLHTQINPGGEMRGQVEEATLPLRIGAIMRGSNQTPPVQTQATGRAVFELSPDLTQLNYAITLTNVISPQMISMHIGRENQMSPPIITITVTSDPVISGTLDINQEQLAALLLDNMYLNVSTTAYPEGEIRGQIIEGLWLNAPFNLYFPFVGRNSQGGTTQ